jgi:hypothetical protein
MICIARFWIRSNSSDKYVGNPLWKTGQAYSVIGRTPIRSTTNGRQSQTNPIVCKFVRRLAQDKVLAARNNSSQVSVNDLKLPSTAKFDRILIFNHLTPRLQELLYEAKKHRATHGCKFCWAKGWAIFLRKTDDSRVIRLNTMQARRGRFAGT